MKNILTALLLLTSINLSAKIYDVRDFGAAGDGKAIDSFAINKAIETASRNGGGQVYVPAGQYICYSIHLMSNVDFHMERGACIIAGGERKFDEAEQGPEPQYQDYGHSHWKNSLFWGIDLCNITISGDGFIDGTSLSAGFGDTAQPKGVGNKAIALKNCRNVTLKDFTVFKGGHFCLLATGVDNLTIYNVTVDTGRDGFDIDCCRNVRITACNVNSPWDDGIVLKSSFALERFCDTRDVTISDCNISAYSAGTMLSGTYVRTDNEPHPATGRVENHRAGGRIKLGTESSGGFKNIAVNNCTFDYCGGLLIESMDGGHVEDITVSNLTMLDCTDCPIFIRLGERMRSPQGTPVGSIKRISISNVNAYNCRGSWPMMITGTPGHRVEDIVLNNIRINYTGGYSKEKAQTDIPENETTYPDPWMFSPVLKGTINKMDLPYRALMLRHVCNIRIDKLGFTFNAEDTRENLYIEDASLIEARNLSIQGKDFTEDLNKE